jgi:2-octaprenyl-6-methoxyphenol hydroxylase
MERSAQVIVVGGGPTGLMAALALASARVDTILVRGNPPTDNRTTALLASSVTALETLGVWSHCRAQAAPLEVMRIVDDTQRLWRAPEVQFSAHEIGLDAFGWNIENRHLLAALAAQAAEESTLRIVFAEALRMEIGEAEVDVAISDGETLRGQLLVGADGHKSACRAAAGIETTSRRTQQTALTFNLAHTRPHHNASTEFHTERGPFTLVPLPGQRSSLVCVVAPYTANRLIGLDPEALALELEQRAHSLLGKFTVESGRGVFPLAISSAKRFAAHRVALIGEAAHVLPPIGAQGLNLGLRDAAMIAQVAGDAARTGADCGARPVTQQYEQQRRADIASRTFAVDVLNRSLLTDFLPLQALRGLGLYALDRVGPLRRALMRAGVDAPLAPRLMRGHRLA